MFGISNPLGNTCCESRSIVHSFLGNIFNRYSPFIHCYHKILYSNLNTEAEK